MNRVTIERSPVLGIIYSKFDEKLGPKPYLYYPESIEAGTRSRVASESMSLSFGRDQVPEALAIIPLSGLGLKALVRFGIYSDADRRGRFCDITISLIFNETDDLIFYKYVKDFQHLFNDYSKAIIHAEEDKVAKPQLQGIVKELHEKSIQLVETLKTAEMAPKEATAFPSSDDGEKSKKEIIKFKIIVCGDPAVGKTSLVLRFTDKAFKRTYMPTLGTNISDKVVEFEDFNLNFQIWDVAGQAKFSRFRKSFYSGASGHCLVFDLTQTETLNNLYLWSKDIKSYIGDTPGLIIGNKLDLVEQRKVNDEAIERISKDLGIRVVLASALSGENVDAAFRTLGLEIVEKFGDKRFKNR